MWQLKNQTPYIAERCFVRDRLGAEIWVVAVKATFAIKPDGTTALSEEQEALHPAAKHRGKPGVSSLLHESDFLLKPGTDFLLEAQAHAPRRKPVQSLDVRMDVGPLSKQLRVFGDRVWQRGRAGPILSAPKPFTSIPLIYERAFGGVAPKAGGEEPNWERRNPVGVGYARTPESLLSLACANIEDPRFLISAWSDRPVPVGFGAIARDWAPRHALAGTYDQRWQSERAPLPPGDFDERFNQCAPADQQVPGYLRGGEPVALWNLSPEHSELRFFLPKVRLVFGTWVGRDTIEHRASLTTVLLEPDRSRLMMTWLTALPCHRREHELRRTLVSEKAFLR